MTDRYWYDRIAPKFVKKFGNVGDVMLQAFSDYDREVKEGVFPAQEHSFAIDDSVLKEIAEMI